MTTLLARLHREGFHLSRVGDRIKVEPAGQLTSEQRELILANRGAILAAIDQQADLEQRIRSMAARWRYTPDELAEVLAAAQTDPAAWLRAIEVDERCEAKFRARGVLPGVGCGPYTQDLVCEKS